MTAPTDRDDGADERKRRQAAALRDNLFRRKAQARARHDQDDAPADQDNSAKIA